MSVFLYIFRNLDQYRKRFWLSVVAGLFASASALAIPLLLASFTAGKLSRERFTMLIGWIAMAVAVSLVSAWYVRKYGEAVAKQFPNHLRLKYFRNLERLPMSQLAKKHSGYVLSMIDQIGEKMVVIFYDIFWWFAGIIVSIGLLVYFTARQTWGLTAFNMGLFVVFVALSAFLGRKQTKLADANNHQAAVYGQYFVDFMTNLVTIKRLGIREFADKTLTAKALSSNQKIQSFQTAHAGRWLLLHAIYYTANFVTIGYLLYQISQSLAPVSLLIVFIAFYGNLRTIIERSAENIITFAETRVYIGNLTALLDYEQPGGGQHTQDGWKTISLRTIAFNHPGSSALIRIPELVIHRGDKICLYGTSGEGKSTVLNLAANFLKVDEGERRVDATAYEDLSATWFADQAAYISQETELFNLSVRDNLLLGRKMSDQKLWQLLEDLELAVWAHGLVDGLDTIVGEKGLRLSAGQKQRVNLARGIILDRSLYLLDEPTAHLDDATEAAVIKTIEKYLADKTLLIVTHRPAIKKICSTFYKMSKHTVLPEK